MKVERTGNFIMIIFIFSLFLLPAIMLPALADVSLPKIFSDHMVLQRDTQVQIWGWAAQGENITISFNNQKKSVVAGKDGKWSVELSPMAAGGPFELQVSGKNRIVLKNILIGEVWICSGQSNMQRPVSWAFNADQEMAAADYPHIRLFTVERILRAKPIDDLNGGEWQICNPSTINEFSAVGYFFGRALHSELAVPVGLISTNWGGTVSETWTSREAFQAFPEFADKLTELEKTDVETMFEERDQRRKEWESQIEASDMGMKEKWYMISSIPAEWQKMDLPQLWENAGLNGLDGIVWFMKEITLTQEDAAKSMVLRLGPVDDSDHTYVNGSLVGSTEGKYDKIREYEVKPEVLKTGKNIICVRVTDIGGGGGLWGKAEELFYKSGENKAVTLAGEWSYQIGSKQIPTLETVGPNSYPTLLFNAMIHPLIPFTIKGAIWYQGESNARRAYQYREIFPAMITDWRKNWGQGDFPFLFVQLANFMKAKDEPGESSWAELREAQMMTLSLPNTGMAVIIDIGKADDIHPRNKQDVGFRLARNALKIAYQQDVVYSGPLYQSFKIEDDKIRINFTNTGSGLAVKDRYGYLKGFSIAGKDKKFVWAKAQIEGNEVIVHNTAVQNPVAVRYGWADNPDDVNLYNREGFPASPFRTDDWPGVTAGKK